MSGDRVTPETRSSDAKQAQILQAIVKGQQMAGHEPTADDLGRAARVLSGETTIQEAVAELDAIWRPGSQPTRR